MADHEPNPPAVPAFPKPRSQPRGRSLAELWLKDGSSHKGIPDPQNPPRYGTECRLLTGEWKLLACTASGEPCVLGKDRPPSGSAENTVRAGLLRFVALGGVAGHPLHEHGVQLHGAWIDCAGGELDFFGAVLPENFRLSKCTVESVVNLTDAVVETLVFDGCRVGGILADRLEARGDLNLGKGFCAQKTVRLSGARITGELECSGGIFEGTPVALNANGIETGGPFFMRKGFKAIGTVRLHGAKITADLYCRGGLFECETDALSVDRAKIGGHVYFDQGFHSAGKVSLEDAVIGTGLKGVGGHFGAGDHSLSLRNSNIGGNVDFGVWKGKEVPEGRLPCYFNGGVSLQRAEINGDLIFTETRFGSACLVNLRNVDVNGQLMWRQIENVNPEADPVADVSPEDNQTGKAQATYVSELNLSGATCVTLNMDWESWIAPGQVRLDHFTYLGFSELPAQWDANRWIGWLEQQPDKHLNQRFRPQPYKQLAKVLHDSGFEEEARSIRIEHKERQRLFSLYHEPRSSSLWGRFVHGLGNFWRLIEKFVTAHGYRPGLTVFWLIGLVAVGAGIYQWAALKGIMTPTHPLIYKEAVWEPSDPAKIVEELTDGKLPPGKAPAACRENWVYPPDIIKDWCAASVPSEYSTFNALVYSLDTAIPVVNFRMEDDWSPRVVNWQSGQSDFSGWLVRSWEWLQIILGWAFSLLFVSAISGVIRRE